MAEVSLRDLWLLYTMNDPGFRMLAQEVVNRTIETRNEMAKRQG